MDGRLHTRELSGVGTHHPSTGAPAPDPGLLLALGSINLDNLQSLSSDNATMAMQQAMMAAHDDSLDGTEEEEEDEMEEEEEEELEE